jgi:hypothetical protein
VVASLPPGQAGTSLEIDRWAPPLFEVAPDQTGTWLDTVRPARIIPFARIAQDRWLATVAERGALAPATAPAWEPLPRRAARMVRVLAVSDQVPPQGTLRTGPPVRTESSGFGWRTSIVPAPLADVTSVWLRSANSPAGRDHLEAEQAFFQATELRLPGLSPRCLGRSEDGQGYLYAPPLAFRAADSAPLRAWERDDPLAFVQAAVRLWQTLSDEGLALGFYHPSTLGFRVLFGGSAQPRLQAVALAAPLATRLGAAYRRSRETIKLFPQYERIGLRLPPPHHVGDVALPETEAMSLALYAVDRLLPVPVDIPEGAPWDEFVDMLVEETQRRSLLRIAEPWLSVLSGKHGQMNSSGELL